MTQQSIPTTFTPVKPLLVTFILLVGLSLAFWHGSRYPDLDQKALMAGETQFSAIGFDVIVDMPANANVLVEIAVNAANWMYTNWRGMSFGMLAGALFLTLMPLLSRISITNRFANSAIGMLMGAPLGVCVNCAAPIAQGLYAGGAKPETAIAALVSSPTLNVIVLTMVLSLFPPYLAWTKIGLSLAFVLFFVPLLVRSLYPHDKPLSLSGSISKPSGFFAVPVPSCFMPAHTWGAAIMQVLKQSIVNLVYIVRVALPLMIIAGVAGAAVVTIAPFDSLADFVPIKGGVAIVIGLFLLALFALFLPVPMAFDVIVVAVLFQAGLPASYAAVLLFALGVFSVYPFMLIWSQMSKAVAIGMVLVLALLSVVVGVYAHYAHKRDIIKQQDELLRGVAANPGSAPWWSTQDRPAADLSQLSLVRELQQYSMQYSTLLESDNVILRSRNHHVPTSGATFGSIPVQNAGGFTRLDADDVGLTEGHNISLQKLLIPYGETRSIASGDIHNDGWHDIVVASSKGIGVYANRRGSTFQQQEIRIPQFVDTHIGAVALVDLTNDGWLDLFVSTWRNGTWMVVNDHGEFRPDGLQELPNRSDALLVTAPAFGDIDNNGELDIVLGNSSIGNIRQDASLTIARNRVLMQNNGRFEAADLPGVAAETLSTLLVDLNGDNWLDLIVGNDFAASDIVYLNDGTGQLQMQPSSNALLPNGGRSTMSLSSADIDNDLVSEVFLAQKAWERGSVTWYSPEAICSEIGADQTRQDCERLHQLGEAMRSFARSGSAFTCQELDLSLRSDCLALKVFTDEINKRPSRVGCETLDKGWPRLAEDCRAYSSAYEAPTEAQLDAGLPSIMSRNFLFAKDDGDHYSDAARALGLQHGGWSWNAKFADLDNDEWQDLLIVTGVPMARLRHPLYLYKNNAGVGFTDVADEAGLSSNLDIVSYTYIDMDNDGDLDVIMAPVVGPLMVYRNDYSGGSITVDLDDDMGNSKGIGANVTIHYADGKKQMRDLLASGGYQSYDAPILHFGMGTNESVSNISVRWADGEFTTLDGNFAVGQHYSISRAASQTQ